MACTLAVSATGELAAQQVSRSEPAMTDSLWSAGVPQKERQQAEKLYQEGASFFAALNLSMAEKRYKEALEHWRHPGILFHLALTQHALSKSVQAYQTLIAALQYGAAPFAEPMYQQALATEKQLRGKVAEIAILCEDPGAEIVLDGQTITTATTFFGQETVKRYVLPGEHQVHIVKQGYEPLTQRVVLAPGESKVVKLRLYTPRQLTKHKRYVWQVAPWLLVSTGAAFGLAGLLSFSSAKTTMATFDAELSRVCPGGCPGDSPNFPGRLLQDAEEYQTRERLWFVGAGILVTTGLVLAYFNRPRPYRIAPPVDSVRITTQPLLGHEAAGLQIHVSF
jgi:hypothetical protein